MSANLITPAIDRARSQTSTWDAVEKMKANVFHGQNDIRVEEVEKPRAGIGEAVIRVRSSALRFGVRVDAGVVQLCLIVLQSPSFQTDENTHCLRRL